MNKKKLTFIFAIGLIWFLFADAYWVSKKRDLWACMASEDSRVIANDFIFGSGSHTSDLRAVFMKRICAAAVYGGPNDIINTLSPAARSYSYRESFGYAEILLLLPVVHRWYKQEIG